MYILQFDRLLLINLHILQFSYSLYFTVIFFFFFLSPLKRTHHHRRHRESIHSFIGRQRSLALKSQQIMILRSRDEKEKNKKRPKKKNLRSFHVFHLFYRCFHRQIKISKSQRYFYYLWSICDCTKRSLDKHVAIRQSQSQSYLVKDHVKRIVLVNMQTMFHSFIKTLHPSKTLLSYCLQM